MQSKSRLTDFQIQTKLGSGSYGVIYRVVRRSDRKIYVLKQVSLGNMKEKMRKNAINEATILSRLNSPFIVRYLDSFIDQNCLNIVMEYCEGGDLALLLKQQSSRPMKQDKIWKIFLQICLGLEYIHSKRILHRDVKTLNIFLTRDEVVKIGDLGVAKLLHDNADFAQTMVGTPFYLSPQLCEEKPYNEKSDIWALGCLLYEMCTYKHPFEAANQGSLILKIVRGRYNPISETYSKQLRETVDSCLERDYKRRPTASVLLSRPGSTRNYLALKQKYEQLAIKAIVEKYEGQESKRTFALQLERELNKKEQASQPQPSTQTPSAKKPPIAGKIFEDVKNRKEENKKDDKKQQIKKEQQLKKQEQQRKEEQLRKEEFQKKQEQRKEEQLRRQEQRREQMKRDEIRKEQIRKQQARKEEQRKKEKEEQLKKLEIQRREQAQQNYRRSEEKRKEELKRHEDQSEHPSKELQPKFVVEKVRYERQVSARVYDNKRPPVASSKELLKKDERKIAPTPKLLSEIETPIQTPSAARIVIKSKGFSNDDSHSRNYSHHVPPSDLVEPSSVKSTEKKYVSSSERKLMVHSNSNHHQSQVQPGVIEQQARQHEVMKKRSSEPKVLFGAAMNVASNQIPPLPPARVRKGAPIEKSRNAKNPVRPKGAVSQEEERLVANLPDESSSDDEGYPKNLAFKNDRGKSGEISFRLKEVDDQEVLRRYEELVEAKETDTSVQQTEQAAKFEPVQQHREEDIDYIEDDREEAQPTYEDDSLEHSETVHYQDETHYEEEASNEFIPEAEEHFPAPHQQQQQPEEQILEDPATFQQQNNEWQYDEQPELPAFEEANMLLMQPEQEDKEQTRNYLQDKLTENMKRQDQLNQLMQLKIDECRRAFKSNYDEVIEFLRKKINMESEYNEADERQVDQFLRSRKLTDAKKFQNIYKIMHFEMELENCRNIIQGICKKLAQLDR